MRLRLKQTEGPVQAVAARGDWYLERGRRTIGRSSACDWQIEDDRRTISKHHFTIERTMDGFVLHDESANGTNVDGRLVMSGESARLTDGSHIILGRYAFDAVISGLATETINDPDADLRLSDENLTISSILANVTPAGIGGHGILGNGGQSSDLPGRRPDGKRKQIPIGWEGPPKAEGIGSLLPDDWNKESELSTALEHQEAIRSHAPRIRAKAAADAGPLPQPEPPVLPETSPASSDLSVIEVAIRRLEAVMGDGEALLNRPPRQPSGIGPYPPDEAQLAARLENLTARLIEHNQMLERLLEGSAALFDPALVEARVDAEPSRFPRLAGPLSRLSASVPWLSALAYWQTYSAQFTADGRRVSARDLLLSVLNAPDGETPAPSRSEKTDKTDEI
ncbi:forkhead-associated protein [Brucella endophytica]|uniref:Forkhead-associated protein n=1 Tax=Brucella endophytica TaxID=1963359 RepID=A0A916WCW7_9HYPH|nr:FHA domain-containing protein [Brucella endophytica]GGA88229.1 forkhead-associated protein [Brucella endophytica]